MHKIQIGKLIHDELRRQERGATWLSRKINCHVSNIYKIFEKDSIDTEILFRISQALQHDFFKYYSDGLSDES